MTIVLRRDGARPLRIGHRGAPALAPENTLRSLARAVEHELDLVELDVISTRDGQLVLGHSYALRELTHGAVRGSARARSLEELRRVAPELPTLDEALAFLTAEAPHVGVQVDIKEEGYESPVLDSLRRHDLLARSFVSSYFLRSLRAVAEAEPDLPRSLTYPQDRFGVTRSRALVPAVAVALAAFRRALPYRIGGLLARSGASAATLHYALCSRAVVQGCHARGAAVLAWTVDDPNVLQTLARAGVDGMITNDPRIFDLALT
ncbi:MAG TPA: glycerophosphodiester phosphodiesterase [Gaiellaceae bacterium]